MTAPIGAAMAPVRRADFARAPHKLMRGLIAPHKPRRPTTAQRPTAASGAANRVKAAKPESDLRVLIVCFLQRMGLVEQALATANCQEGRPDARSRPSARVSRRLFPFVPTARPGWWRPGAKGPRGDAGRDHPLVGERDLKFCFHALAQSPSPEVELCPRRTLNASLF